MFKKIVSGVLAITLTFSAFGLAGADSIAEIFDTGITASASTPYFTVGDWQFFINNDDDDSVAIYKYLGSDTTAEIPSYVKYGGVTYTVTQIGHTYSGIDGRVFEDYCPETVIIPDTVTTIDNDAFEKSDNLKYVEGGTNVVTICSGAFYNCKGLKSVNFPNAETIKGAAFYGCESLESFYFGSNLTTIGSSSFSHCTSLKNVVLDSALTSIGNGAFNSCKSLDVITIPDNITKLEQCTFSYSGISKVIFSNTSIEMEKYCFDNCTSLTSIVNLNGEVGNYAFTGCTSLVLDESSFGTATRIGKGAFKDCTSIANVKIPNSVASIGEYAFMGCTSLASVTIPSTVTTIDALSFGYINQYKKVANFKIYSYAGTAGETYAIENGFDYKVLEGTDHNHSYTSTVTTEATCVNDGVMTYTCTCGDTYTETIPATGKHDYKSTVIKPTTTSKGYTKNVCKVCGDTTKTNYTDMLIAMSKCTTAIAKSAYVYTGKAIKPAVTVKKGSVTLKKGTDYTVSYKNNTSTGKATITVKGKGNYSGTLTLTFNIVPAQTKLSAVTSPAKSQIKITWKKDSQATGYQIVYSTDKSFKKSVVKTFVTKNTTTSKTVKSLSAGKKYYVKVRSYKVIDGKKVYGAFSTVKSVTVKKK